MIREQAAVLRIKFRNRLDLVGVSEILHPLQHHIATISLLVLAAIVVHHADSQHNQVQLRARNGPQICSIGRSLLLREQSTRDASYRAEAYLKVGCNPKVFQYY